MSESDPLVRVEPEGILLALRPGETLFDAAFRQGVSWPTVCFGQARCAACRVEVRAGHAHCSPVEATERAVLERIPARLGGGPDLRLACQLRVRGAVTVDRQPTRGT